MGTRSGRAAPNYSLETVISDFAEITQSKPEKSLVKYRRRDKAKRSNRGVITSRRRGGVHKRLYQAIDFRRQEQNQHP
jgi:large subunit ribosomal protein L2